MHDAASQTEIVPIDHLPWCEDLDTVPSRDTEQVLVARHDHARTRGDGTGEEFIIVCIGGHGLR